VKLIDYVALHGSLQVPNGCQFVLFKKKSIEPRLVKHAKDLSGFRALKWLSESDAWA
jgi:hypothetical protein